MNTTIEELAATTTILNSGVLWSDLFAALEAADADEVEAINSAVFETDEIRKGDTVSYMTDERVGEGQVRRIIERGGSTEYWVFDPLIMDLLKVDSSYVSK